ncbi:MAG: S16 family serine protease [Planctomycetaceae bacterium]
MRTAISALLASGIIAAAPIAGHSQGVSATDDVPPLSAPADGIPEGLPPADPQRANVTPRTVLIVHPVAFAQSASGEAVGLCIPARLEIGGVPPGRVRVGVYEPEVGGTTDVWRATTWSAAIVAAQLTDFDSRALQLSVEVPVSIDGPSAGALLTAALVANSRGDTLMPNITMTGTINPDGVIGPVGGIPLKIDGAAQAGKSTLLIPDGTAFEIDPRTGENVNLVQYGKRRGVSVVAVGDIWAAYSRLTGQELPRDPPGRLPRMGERVDQLMHARIDRWVRMNNSARAKYYNFPDFARTEFSERLIEQSDEMFEKALSLLNSGESTGAYIDVVNATMWTWIAHEFARYTHQLQTGGKERMMELPYTISWLDDEVRKTTAAIKGFKPRTVDQLAMYLNACSSYFSGLCAYQVAEDLKAIEHSNYISIYQQGSAQGGASIYAGIYQTMAWLLMKQATDFIELAASYEGQPLQGRPSIVNARHFYRRGAEATLEVLNELHIHPMFAEEEVSDEFGKSMLAIADDLYATSSVGLNRVLPGLPALLGEGDTLEYVSLAAAMTLYSRTSALLAKYYSVGIETDNAFQITRIVREQKLTDWLDASRQQCERSINALDRQGIDTTTCVQMYRVSRISEGREAHDKFNALGSYFATNLMAELLMQVAGDEGATDFAAPSISLPTPPPPPAPAAAASPATSGTTPARPVPAFRNSVK